MIEMNILIALILLLITWTFALGFWLNGDDEFATSLFLSGLGFIALSLFSHALTDMMVG